MKYALALMRDTSKLVALGTGTTAFAKAQIQVYSPAGEGLLLFSVVISLYCHVVQKTDIRYASVHSGTKGRLCASDGLGMRGLPY